MILSMDEPANNTNTPTGWWPHNLPQSHELLLFNSSDKCFKHVTVKQILMTDKFIEYFNWTLPPKAHFTNMD